jgi:hypothetical protein
MVNAYYQGRNGTYGALQWISWTLQLEFFKERRRPIHFPKHDNTKSVYFTKSEFVKKNEIQNITGLSRSSFLQWTTRYNSTCWHRGQTMTGSLLSISHWLLRSSKSSADTHEVQWTIYQAHDVPVMDWKLGVWAYVLRTYTTLLCLYMNEYTEHNVMHIFSLSYSRLLYCGYF